MNLFQSFSFGFRGNRVHPNRTGNATPREEPKSGVNSGVRVQCLKSKSHDEGKNRTDDDARSNRRSLNVGRKNFPEYDVGNGAYSQGNHDLVGDERDDGQPGNHRDVSPNAVLQEEEEANEEEGQGGGGAGKKDQEPSTDFVNQARGNDSGPKLGQSQEYDGVLRRELGPRVTEYLLGVRHYGHVSRHLLGNLETQQNPKTASVAFVNEKLSECILAGSLALDHRAVHSLDVLPNALRLIEPPQSEQRLRGLGLPVMDQVVVRRLRHEHEGADEYKGQAQRHQVQLVVTQECSGRGYE